MSEGCLKGFWRDFEGCIESVLRESRSFLEALSEYTKLSGCQEDFWRVSRGHSDDVWTVTGRYLGKVSVACREGVWKLSGGPF